MTRLLICGGTGFIGRNLCERFAGQRGFTVTATWHQRPPFDWPGLTWRHADLRRPDEVAAALAGQDVVVQAAAVTSGAADIRATPHVHVTDNAVMNSLILREAFEQSLGQVVFFSCTVMYPPGLQPRTEDDFDPGAVHPPYFGAAWTKVYIERVCEFFARQGRTRHTVIRHSNIYGPHDKFDAQHSHVFGASLRKVLDGDARSVSVWGSGEDARDLLFVGDLVDFVERALDQDTPYELCNVGLGETVTVNDLVGRMVKASGRTLTIEHDPRGPTIGASFAIDTSRAERVFGWRPATSLDRGIAATMHWYRERQGHPGDGRQ